MTSRLLLLSLSLSLVAGAGCADSHGLDSHPPGVACGARACVGGAYCVDCPEGPICTDADPAMQSDLWSPHSECAGVGLAPFAERPRGPVRFCDDDSDCAAGTFCGVYADSEWVSCISPDVPTGYERACRDEGDCAPDERCVVVDGIARCRR